MTQQYKNILVHALVNLGDVIFSTAALAVLRKAYPEAKITFMVRPGIAPVLVNHPCIDEVIAYDYKSKGDRLGVWRMAQELRRRQFDVSISLDRRPRLALLTWLAGIPVRIGADKLYSETTTWATCLYTHTVHIPYALDSRLQAETFQEVIRQFAGTNEQARPLVGQPQQPAMDRARAMLASLPTGKRKVALCVRAVHPLKNWPPERFAELIQRLAATQEVAFFVVGAPEDRDYAEDIIRASVTPVANFCGQTSLPELLALFFQADLMITIDNGAAHLAAATNLPIVSIFNCTTPKRAKPSAEVSIALGGDLPCCPCDHTPDSCPNGRRCLTAVGVEDVLPVVNTVLKEINVSRCSNADFIDCLYKTGR